MKSYIEKYWWVFAMLFLLLPFFINSLSCFNAPYSSWQEPSEWTKFWGQYLSGFMAFIMLYVAWRTLKTTKEANRPYIMLDVVDKGMARVFIRCRNIGNSTATNIKISVDDSFINSLTIDKVKESLLSINNATPFVLESNGVKIWEIFCIPGTVADAIHDAYGKDGSYSFKGEKIQKSLWKTNEAIFKSTVVRCKVEYNNEYSELFDIDYNNMLDGISSTQRISDNIFSIVISLSKIESELKNIKSAINGNEQTK